MSAALIGREAELEQGRAFLRTSAVRGGRLSLTGAAGIGKTALWQTLLADASRTFRVLRANPAQAETGLAYGVLTDLLWTVPSDAFGPLPQPQREALLAAVLRSDPGRRVHHRRAVSAALRTLLAGLAERRPVLVAIDDLQWVDAGSAGALEFALRRLGGSRVAVLTASRAGEPAVRDAVDGQATELGPLDARAVEQLVGDRLTSAQARRVHRLAAGNPFFALELARSLAESPDEHLPTSLTELVAHRLAALPEPTRRVLVVVAVAGTPTTAQLARATGESLDRVLDALDPAGSAGLLHTGTGVVDFTHPLYRAGVLASAGAATARAAHRAVAAAGGSPEARARHRAAAAVEPDEALALDLDDAARSARARGAADAAAELLGHAIRLTPARLEVSRARRVVTLADVRFRAGEVHEPQRLLDTVLAEPPSAGVETEALELLAELRYQQGNFDDALTLFGRVLERTGDDVPARLRARVHMAHSAVASGEFTTGVAYAADACDLAPAEPGTDLDGWAAQAHGVAVIAGFLDGRGVDEDRLAQALDRENDTMKTAVELRPTLIAGSLRLYEGRLAEACELLTSARVRAHAHGDEIDLPVIESTLAWTLTWLGDLEAARQATAAGLLAARRSRSATGEALALAYGCVGTAYRGEFAALRAQTDRVPALLAGTGYGVLRLWTAWGLTVAALQQGHSTDAVAAAEPIVGAVERHGLVEPVRAVLLADGIEALVADGHLDRAAALVTEFESVAIGLDRAWAIVGAHRCRALLAAARGELDAAAAAIDTALRLVDGLELRLEAARTHLVAGQIARRRRQRRAAGRHLATARTIFAGSGAAGWVGRADEELARVGTVRRPSPELSTTEHLVAGLAATGLTNAQVARRLRMSTKTVEAHLTRTYAKLGIHTRAELGARFALADRA